MQDSLSSNTWKHLFTLVDSINSNLKDLDKSLHVKSSLKTAEEDTKKLIELIRAQADNIHNQHIKARFAHKNRDIQTEELIKARVAKYSIGIVKGFNPRKEMQGVLNTIIGVQYALNEKTQTIKDMYPLIARMKDTLNTFKNNISSKIDNQVLDTVVATQIDEEIIASEKFDDLSDAMKEAAKEIAKLQSTQSIDKGVSRDIIHMTQVVKNNNRDLENMQRAIKNSLYGEKDQEFTIVRGPIITDSKLDVTRLQKANVYFDTIFFPGITFGTGFKNKETLPRMFILRNQILVAIQMNATKKKFELKLNNKKSFNKTVKNEDEAFSILRGDILDTLQHKLNYPLIDVIKERQASNYLSSPKFPKVKFIWLLKKSLFDRINVSGGNKIGLPF